MTPHYRRILLLSTSQIESTLCYLDGIILHHVPDARTFKLALSTDDSVYPLAYPDIVKKQVVELIESHQIDMIFLTLIEFSYRRAMNLIDYIRQQRPILVIAGGPHAIEYPEIVIREPAVDVVCYTHGLHIHRLLDQFDDLIQVPNILFKDDSGKIVRTAPRDIQYDMNQLPLPNWSVANSYRLFNPAWYGIGHDEPAIVSIAHSQGGIPVDHHQLPAKHTGVLVLSMGCPVNTCKFCSIARMYDKEVELNNEEAELEEFSKGMLRKTSWYNPANAIATIHAFLKARPLTKYIVFNDNDFSSIDLEYIPEFSRRYSEEIHLPFYVQSTPHLTVARGRGFLATLIAMGLDTYCMGVQTARTVNVEMYGRAGSDKFVKKAIDMVSEFVASNNIHLALDFINCNPAETRQDIETTIAFIRSFNTPWDMAIHNLTLNDHTELARQIASQAQPLRVMGVPLSIETSDYHHVSSSNFMSLREPYLNFVLEWLDGFHDSQSIGRMPRFAVDLFGHSGFLQAIEQCQELETLLHRKQLVHKETLDVLLDDDVYQFFYENLSLLDVIHTHIPATFYSYQRSDRLEYDWKKFLQ